MDEANITRHLANHPFARRPNAALSEEIVLQDILHVVKQLGWTGGGGGRVRDLVALHLPSMATEWKKKEKNSEIALEGMLLVLEYCLSSPNNSSLIFEALIASLGFHSVQFWKVAVNAVFESDLSAHTKYRDALLFALTLCDVNTGKNRLQEVYAAVPGMRESLLGETAKQFGEKYHHLQKRLSRHGSRSSLNEGTGGDRSPRRGSLDPRDTYGEEEGIPSGLASSHFHQRVINVSNAPPVSLKREKSGEWEIKQGSGGLVSCVDPVMSKHEDNVWLANLGMNMDRRKSFNTESSYAPATNTLGLPLIKQHIAEVLFHVLAEEDGDVKAEESERQKKASQDLSLLGVLNSYNKGRYKLNPVVVQEEDYNVYYGGISNGLLWPALHNLPEYISDEYTDSQVLRDHWCAYVRVNYQFAIDAVRNSRPQDFIWIHDYHLVLVGLVMQSLDPNLEVGFFLHIPFQPPQSFFDNFSLCALPLLRGLLRFTKVGFQTNRDRDRFVDEVRKHLSFAKPIIVLNSQLDIYTITMEGNTCSLGVFPVSIKNDDFLQYVDKPQVRKLASDIRVKTLGTEAPPDARLFFSVERFDYTKGIREKLHAYKKYLEDHPERHGKDVLYQIAVTNRRSVDAYRVYQDECLALAHDINDTFGRPKWTPVLFETDGLPRDQLVSAYLAMDIGVVTPRKDGMNLVAKEMLVVNPRAGLILSTGAGSEIQFYNAGLYGSEQNYTRVDDLYDVEEYSKAFYQAAIQSDEERARKSKVLNEFLLAHDIERWSTSFLDPRWTHHVIQPTTVSTLEDFYTLMKRTLHIRRQIVDRVLEGVPIRQHYAISLTNARDSLLSACTSPHTLTLKPSANSRAEAVFDIRDELTELERDLSFIQYIESEDPDNVEQFVQSLFDPQAKDAVRFSEQVEAATDLLTRADHFYYFFTDRDGTLKSYSCSYAASIQPAYSGVIQAQFARRCAQTCVILTTAPLMKTGILDVSSIPEGYYYYGASAGRDWYVSPTVRFKDESITKEGFALLDKLHERLVKLLEEEKFRMFTWLGSGLQRHYGHVTIAHQDVHSSAPQSLADALKERVERIVKEVDGEGRLTVLHQDRDTKCMLKSEGTSNLFNKGEGIQLLCTNMNCDLTEGNILVCGDSSTDLPMLEECLRLNSIGVFTVWVTKDVGLQEKVSSLCSSYKNDHFVFVDAPEVILGAMAQATIRETCRKRDYDSYE